MVETSIILLNYNGLKYLKNCVPSVLRQTYRDFELIIVDNGSRDGSLEWLKKHYGAHPKVRLKPLRENRYFAGGNNYGVRFAKGKYIVLLNNDTVAPRSWLGNLIRGMKRSNADVVSSLVPDKEIEKRVLEMVFKENKFATMNVIGNMVTIEGPGNITKSSAVEIFFVGGNALCYKRSLFTQPFDEDYVIYAEDIYLCWRARTLGASCKIILDSRIEHLGSGSKNISRYVNKVAVFNGMKNQWLNFLLFYEAKNVFKIFPLFLIGQIAYTIHRPRNWFTRLKVWWWVATNCRRIWRKRKEIQRARTVADDQLLRVMSYQLFNDELEKMPKIVRLGTYAMNWFFKAYCWVFRIKTREFVAKDA